MDQSQWPIETLPRRCAVTGKAQTTPYLAGALNTWKSMRYTGLDLVNMYVIATAVTRRQQDTKLTCTMTMYALSALTVLG